MDGEDVIDHELEAKLYAKLYHEDETQPHLSLNNTQGDISSLLGNVPKTPVRRYWHTDTNKPSQDVNLPKQLANSTNRNEINNIKYDLNNVDKLKHNSNNNGVPKVTESLSLPVSKLAPTTNLKTAKKINDPIQVVELLSSDEDEVIEIPLPPKPTINIDSSEEEELPAPQVPSTKKCNSKENIFQNTGRDSASPVPSVVSSVSDEFIRGDCIALNISSKRPDDHSFDFSLHGNDLVGKSTPSKKKKKKKSKDRTSTPISNKASENSGKVTDECFATPRNKSKKQKTTSYIASSIPNADVYDSDSNQSTKDTSKDPKCSVIEKNSLSTNACESESNNSMVVKDNNTSARKSVEIDSPDSVIPLEDNYMKGNSIDLSLATIDLTEHYNENSFSFVESVEENIVMANVSGLTEHKENSDDLKVNSISNPQNNNKYGSTKVPSILYENLDFDNLKGKTVSRQRRYSLTTLRAEMEKFYNESWGGENFNHKEIQKNMSRDKSLWAIDPEDKGFKIFDRKVSCQYCNKYGHRENSCFHKPEICHMCGTAGHIDFFCPKKICCNCGSPSKFYRSVCENCSTWTYIYCNDCGQRGHPSSHCPDIWRRYHNTIDDYSVLVESNETKKNYNLFCSGCARRGHLVHTCRSPRFSDYFINSPYVSKYIPKNYQHQKDKMYDSNQRNMLNRTFPQDSHYTKRNNNKRQSKSPSGHDSHSNKKRMLFDSTGESQNKNQVKENKTSSKETIEDGAKMSKEKRRHSLPVDIDPNKALDFIPINSSNHNERGQIIQDSEVSDTSYVITSSRVYVTRIVMDRLGTKEGEDWLKTMMDDCNVTVEFVESKLFFNVKGKIENQEIFQKRLREWTNFKVNTENPEPIIETESNFRRVNRILLAGSANRVIQFIKKKFEILNQNLGDPNTLYSQLLFLKNNRDMINGVKDVNVESVDRNSSRISEIRRKLNMVLLGQAGLADGFKHLTELQSIYQKILNDKPKGLTMALRREIKKHYCYIFSPLPRGDYVDLIKKFYLQQPTVDVERNKLAILQGDSRIFPSINLDRDKRHKRKAVNSYTARNKKTVLAAHTLLKYRMKLLRVHPTDSYRKKVRLSIMKKLKNQIDTVSNSASMPPKIYKKVRKIQEQAELFLSSV